MYARTLRPLLFSLSPAAAHAAAFAALAPVEHFGPLRACLRAAMAPPDDGRLAVRAMGLTFPTPLGLAAGFDKNALRPRALAALGFGHIELGTVTAQPQAPNPAPNLFRLPEDRALVNRLGFPNQGAARVARRVVAARRGASVPLGVSIGKSRAVPADDLSAVIADYGAAFDAIRGVADFVVVNVSSPNTAGLRGLQAKEHAQALLGAIAARASGSVPLLVKMSPDLDDAAADDLLSVVAATGLAGVVAANTTVSRSGLKAEAAHVASLGNGGLSGPPLRERAVALVRRARSSLGRGAVVIGVGGVERAEHAMALVRAGADLVQMYTGFIYEGPGAPARIARGLVEMARREGVSSIAELVGAG